MKTHIPIKQFSEIFELADGSLVLPADSAFIIMNDQGKILEKRSVNTKSWDYALHMDRKGQLWIGFDHGLVRVELDESFNTLNYESYSAGRIRDIVEDASGNLFFAKEGEGVMKLGWNHREYTYISLPPGSEDVYAFNYIEDAKGNFWT